MKDINFSTGLVVLPFAHLLLASTYLYAYCFGFGANLSTFVSASDIFTTSIRNLAPIYAVAALLAFLTVRPRLGHWLTSVAEVPEVYGPWRRHSYNTPLIRIWKVVAIASTASWVTTSYLTGKPIDVHFIVGGGLGLLFFQDVLVNARQTRDVTIVLFLIATVVATVAFGLNSGQRDRHAPLPIQSASNATCGEYVVLRRFSDVYLALGKDNRHRLIANDCSVKFTVPAVKPIVADRETVPVALRWLF